MIITWTELKDARALRDWTQQELADAIGVHPKTIVNWESKGVPPKSAYKVQRALNEELAYVEHRSMNPDDRTSFEDFREELRRQRHLEFGRAREEWETRSAEVDERANVASLDQEYEIEKQQAAYDARVALQDTLAQYDSITLLREVEQRIRRMQAELRADVGPLAEDDEAEIEVSGETQSAYRRAAHRGPRKADEPYAE